METNNLTQIKKAKNIRQVYKTLQKQKTNIDRFILGKRIIDSSLDESQYRQQEPVNEDQLRNMYNKQVLAFQLQGLKPVHHMSLSNKYHPGDIFKVDRQNHKKQILKYPQLYQQQTQNKIAQKLHEAKISGVSIRIQAIMSQLHLSIICENSNELQVKAFDKNTGLSITEACKDIDEGQEKEKRVMMDQMYKSILRSFRSFYRKLFSYYNECIYRQTSYPMSLSDMLQEFINELGIQKYKEAYEALDLIIMRKHQAKPTKIQHMFMSSFNHKNNRKMRQDLFKNDLVQKMWKIYSLSGILDIQISKIHEKYGIIEFQRFEQEKNRIQELTNFDVFQGFQIPSLE